MENPTNQPSGDVDAVGVRIDRRALARKSAREGLIFGAGSFVACLLWYFYAPGLEPHRGILGIAGGLFAGFITGGIWWVVDWLCLKDAVVILAPTRAVIVHGFIYRVLEYSQDSPLVIDVRGRRTWRLVASRQAFRVSKKLYPELTCYLEEIRSGRVRHCVSIQM